MGIRFRVQTFRNLAFSVFGLNAQLFHVELRNGVAGMLTCPTAEQEMLVIMAARDRMLETVQYICIYIYIYIPTYQMLHLLHLKNEHPKRPQIFVRTASLYAPRVYSPHLIFVL